MKKRLTAFDLKIIATILMLLDHVAKYLPEYLPGSLDIIFRYAGRVVAPIFFYLAVESYFHTNNKKRYILRLYIAAAIMAVGNLVVMGFVIDSLHPSPFYYLGQNIFLTIAIGVSIVAGLEWEKKTKKLRKIIPISIVYCLSILAIFTEYSYFALILFFIFYFCRGKKYLFWVYSIMPLIILFKEIYVYHGSFWTHNYEWFAVAAIPLLLLYNDKKGQSFKYFFYVFYPLHVWLLYYLSYALLKN